MVVIAEESHLLKRDNHEHTKETIAYIYYSKSWSSGNVNFWYYYNNNIIIVIIIFTK